MIRDRMDQEKTMKRKSVVSGNIRSIGYEALSQTLEVEFDSGRVYEYYDVPDDDFP